MAKAQTLVDNFSDGVAPQWGFSVAPGPVTERIREVNGRAEITPASGLQGLAGYRSILAYDLTNSWAYVEVRQAVTKPDTLTYLRINDGAQQINLALYSDDLVCQSAGTEVARVPYDPDRHRWWRIREEGGTTFWETSADGMAWEMLANAPNPFNLTMIRMGFGVQTLAHVPSPGMAVFDNFNLPQTALSRRTKERRLSARDVRAKAAALAAEQRHDEQVNNNDEVNYPTSPFVGNYSKSLKHDALGDPDPGSYGTLLRALESREPLDFEEIILASPTAVKLTNPQSGLAFDVEGPDAQALTQIPAPRFDSEVAAHEAGELYWMAVARDVYFGSYATDTVIAAAINSLKFEFPRFGGSTIPVTAQNIFRGIYPGEQVGPYVSQFLLKGNTDQRKPDGLGRDANEGYVSHGAQVNDQRIIPAAGNVDYLTVFSTWLDVQNGVDKRGEDTFDLTRRFIRNLRDGATYVHFDQVLNAYYNAAWILMTEPVGNQFTHIAGTTGRPQIDLEFPFNRGNPYEPAGTAMDSKTQVGFGTFGSIHLLQVLAEVLGRAIREVWWQKWGVHRRLRPEEYGGRVHNQITGARTYGINTSITTSLTSGALAPYFGNTGEKFPESYLLPQAYPEGAPTHPAYGAGHATGSGACVTILKAFFDETTPIENPVIASSDGLSLVAYTGADAGQMTVGGELNKLAGNISLFRNAAGVHWRSDYTESLPLGEAVAIRLLQEMSIGFNEDDAFFELTKFNGRKIRIFDGKVVPVE